MKKIKLIVIAFSCCYACQIKTLKLQEEKKVEVVKRNSPISNRKLMDSLMTCAILHSDKIAYSNLSTYYLMAERGEEILYVALSVANKYNNELAYFHVFLILNSMRTGENIENLDEKTKDFALYHLLKSYEMGYDEAKYKVEEIFEGKKIPKSSYYLNEYVQESNK